MYATACTVCKKEVVFKGLDPQDGDVSIQQGETKDGKTATLVSGVVHVAYCPLCSRQRFLEPKKKVH